ncbi:MAG: hypothetical protein C5B57_13305 [Blastocatellia bacterium]|nr:MAG: hypothetical protein C5B57_13305 [Blastocatellia bacterium]
MWSRPDKFLANHAIFVTMCHWSHFPGPRQWWPVMAMSRIGILQTPIEESAGPMKPSNRRRPRFRTQLFGYAKSEVRTFIARLQADVEQSRAWADSVARDLERSQRDPDSQSAMPLDRIAKSQKAVAHLVERTLTSVHRLAAEIQQEAQKEADEIVADARMRATRIIEQAIATAGEAHETAVLRLKEVERQIELMKSRHREVADSLESIVTALSQGLTEVSSHRTKADVGSVHSNSKPPSLALVLASKTSTGS